MISISSGVLSLKGKESKVDFSSNSKPKVLPAYIVLFWRIKAPVYFEITQIIVGARLLLNIIQSTELLRATKIQRVKKLAVRRGMQRLRAIFRDFHR